MANEANDLHGIRSSNDPDIFGKRNPDAKRIYFHGIHDTINILMTFQGDNTDRAVVARILEAMFEQTK